jgi:hypothetical protein
MSSAKDQKKSDDLMNREQGQEPGTRKPGEQQQQGQTPTSGQKERQENIGTERGKGQGQGQSNR